MANSEWRRKERQDPEMEVSPRYTTTCIDFDRVYQVPRLNVLFFVKTVKNVEPHPKLKLPCPRRSVEKREKKVFRGQGGGKIL